MDNFIKELLVLVAEYDLNDEIYWDVDLNFFAICNDIFWWGTADLEPITETDLDLLRQSTDDAGPNGIILYCARKRKMRPQGTFYKYIKIEEHKLFNACGPEREVDILNPQKALVTK